MTIETKNVRTRSVETIAIRIGDREDLAEFAIQIGADNVRVSSSRRRFQTNGWDELYTVIRRKRNDLDRYVELSFAPGSWIVTERDDFGDSYFTTYTDEEFKNKYEEI